MNTKLIMIGITSLVSIIILLYFFVYGLLPAIKFKNTEYPIDNVQFKPRNLSKEMSSNE